MNEAYFKYKNGLEFIRKAIKYEDYNLLAEAVELFQESILLDSTYVDSYICLAFIAYTLNKKDYSESLLKAVLEIEPFNIKAQKMIKDILDDNNYIDNKENILNQKLKKQQEFLSHILNNEQ